MKTNFSPAKLVHMFVFIILKILILGEQVNYLNYWIVIMEQKEQIKLADNIKDKNYPGLCNIAISKQRNGTLNALYFF